jgi:hypothetical protein
MPLKMISYKCTLYLITFCLSCQLNRSKGPSTVLLPSIVTKPNSNLVNTKTKQCADQFLDLVIFGNLQTFINKTQFLPNSI